MIPTLLEAQKLLPRGTVFQASVRVSGSRAEDWTWSICWDSGALSCCRAGTTYLMCAYLQSCHQKQGSLCLSFLSTPKVAIEPSTSSSVKLVDPTYNLTVKESLGHQSGALEALSTPLKHLLHSVFTAALCFVDTVQSKRYRQEALLCFQGCGRNEYPGCSKRQAGGGSPFCSVSYELGGWV